MAINRQLENRSELLGYSDRPSAAPGEQMHFMVSSEFEKYEATLVQLIHGDTNQKGPGFKEIVMSSQINGTYKGERQETHVGSHIVISRTDDFELLKSLTVRAWVCPSKPISASDQGIVSCWSESRTGFTLGVDSYGKGFFEIGSSDGAERVSTTHPMRKGVWYSITGSYNHNRGEISVVVKGFPTWPLDDSTMLSTRILTKKIKPTCSADLLIAARSQSRSRKGKIATSGHFNGRIEQPIIYARCLDTYEIHQLDAGGNPQAFSELFCHLDFGRDFSESYIQDLSLKKLHGACVNFPTRALLGHVWDLKTFDFQSNPALYNAIEFHDDDNSDCDWDVAFTLEIPHDIKSGFYAIRLEAQGTEDHIPFFVRPKVCGATSEICFLVPTITYQAYANESILSTSLDTDWGAMTDIEIIPDLYDTYVWDHPELGFSIYDKHSDGSGINYSSWKRPILNMRPKHRYWVTNAPRHFAADLYMEDWLENKGHVHEIITDHDLHSEGVDLVSDYKVIITGSHPEYWTEPMQIALEKFMSAGGRLIYFGGNGFYWVTAVNASQPHIVEVRRGYASSRTWTSHPGEVHLASTGEKGGIWRFRGRSPNAIVGVSFSAQGWSKKAPGYQRLEDSYDKRAAFIFDGVEEELIGDFGLVMDGASGDELDRIDFELGTPTHTLRLATSQGKQSSFYLITHEDLLVTDKNIDGTNNDKVRSDMVYFEGNNGSAVFSLPAMGASGSLSHNNYNNNVSRILDNVIREFIK
jgi:N,N-dimethylformamidase